MREGQLDDRGAAERLRGWVRDDFGIDLTTLDHVGHGADAAADVWRATAADGSQYAVKWSSGGSAAGLVVPASLADDHVPGVVSPCPTRRGRWWSERDGRRLSVTPWVADDRALDRRMSAEFWRAYGAMLAQVHAAEVTDPIANIVPREHYRPDRWIAKVRSVGVRIDDTRSHGPADDLVRDLVAGWHDASDIITELLDQAVGLGAGLRRRPAADVICHGDAHVGNVLVGGGDEFWLIDWDDAVLAPRERDLMFVLDGVLFFHLVTPHERTWFFDGYGDVDIDPARLAYYRCVRTFEDLAEPAEQILDTGLDRSERAEALEIIRGVLSPVGLARQAVTGLPGPAPRT